MSSRNATQGAQPQLSICIPTYNFGRYIGETLNSIIDQLPYDAEIVILDGGSSDDTAAVVTEASARCDRIRFIDQGSRGGIDADMARVVALARADLCWLFSADDVMAPNAIVKVREAARDADLVLLSHSNCSVDMAVIQPRHPVLDSPSAVFDTAGAQARAQYFALAETTEAFFSFMSGLVVRRSVWDVSVPADDFFKGSCWSHAARLLTRMRDRGLRISYIDEPLLARRGDNDSFRADGLVARIALAIDGYIGIVAAIFGSDAPELRYLRRALRREFDMGLLFTAKRLARTDRASRQKLYRLADAIWRDSPRQRGRALLLRILPVSTAFAVQRAIKQVKRT